MNDMNRPAEMLSNVLFPDLTRAWLADKSSFLKLAYRTSAIAGGFGLLIVVFAWFAGEWILALIGESYLPAAPLMVLLLLAASFDLASAPLRSSAYAMGNAAILLRIHILGAAVYVFLFYLMTIFTGLIGPGLASVLTSLMTFSLTAKLMNRRVR